MPPNPARAEPTLSPDVARWFAEEVQPVEGSLRAYFRRTLPSDADVDDLVQDSYVRLLKAREKGIIRSTKPLLFAIARHAVHNFFQRKAGCDLVSMNEEDGPPVLEDDAGVFEFVCRTQELSLLTEAISALPERCREVILMRKIQGYSQKEIAQLLGIAEHTVESLAGKGVRRCAEFFRQRGLARDPAHGR